MMIIDGQKYLWSVGLKYETAPIDGLIEFNIESGPHPAELPQLHAAVQRYLPLAD